MLFEAKKYVEEFQGSCVMIYLNRNEKLEIGWDCLSVKSLKENSDLLQTLQCVLLTDEEEEENMKFTKHDMNNCDQVDLPEPKYDLLRQKEDMISDTAHSRKALTSMMKSQGFGRNATLNYGEGDAPAWWDHDLVSWDNNLIGVNSPKNWKHLKRGPWTKALYEQIQKCYVLFNYDEGEGEPIEPGHVDNAEIISSLENIVDIEPENMDNIDIIRSRENVGEIVSDNGEIYSNNSDFENINFSINASFSNISFSNISFSDLLCETNDNVMPAVNVTKRATKGKFTQQTIKKCRVCGRMFLTENLLIEHITTMHIGEPLDVNRKRKSPDFDDNSDLVCFCGKKYKTKVWLDKHKQKSHNQ